jgi:transcriptional regulator with XRE-family HTH domain
MNIATQTPDLQTTLRQARHARRISQLELALRMGVSQRHVSFVEGGRSRPSRELLAAWLQELDTPLALRNAAMLQAGYAPVYSAAPLGDPSLALADEAMSQLLQAHDPMPALLIDAQWNLLRLNQGARWLALTLMPAAAGLPEDAPLNMLDLLAHPEGFLRRMSNLREVGPTLLAHLHGEVAALPALAPRVEAVAERMRLLMGGTIVHHGRPHTGAPVLTTRFATVHGELAFFSMFTTFGTPQDITLASLRVELMFAADEGTRALLRAQVPAVSAA